MANVNNPNSLSSIPNNLVTPYPPSPIESQFYFYGIYSSPRLIARSSTHLWVEPRLPEAYLTPKELSPLGFHDLHAVWEDIVAIGCPVPVWTLFVLVMLATLPPPAIIWVGVPPGSLTAEDGIKVVSDLRGILFAHSIDIHVEIRESEVTHSAKLYRPVITSNTTAQVREPFSTTVGLPISPAANPTIGGTGGFYISDSKQPGKIFLVTNRHVIFCINEEPNEFYKHATASQSRKKVLLFSDPAIQRYITDIRWGIESKEIIHQQLNRRLETANRMAEEEAIAEREDIELEMRRGENTIKALKEFLAEVSKDWKEQKNRVIGHIIMSPPIGLNIPNYGFTEDWALIELDKSKFSSTNFVGNAIDLGTTIPINELTLWMHPHPANPPSFQYPGNRLLKFYGFIPDEEMYKPSSKVRDQENDPVIMVIKNGHGSGLTVGHLNNIRSFTRYYFEGQMSKEIAVLARNSKSGAFSKAGDSGSSVIDGRGRFVGLLTGGAGASQISDITYVTSANFLHDRMIAYGLQPNFFPVSID